MLKKEEILLLTLISILPLLERQVKRNSPGVVEDTIPNLRMLENENFSAVRR